MKITDSKYNSTISNKSPSFRANIKIVNGDKFKAVLKSLPDSFQVGRITNAEWVISEAAINKPSAFTLEVCNCVGGSIFNPETQMTSMFHLSPYRSNMINLKGIQEEIFRQAKFLKGKSSSNLQGLLFGGESFPNEDFLDVVSKNIEQGIFKSQKYSYKDYQMAWDIQLLNALKDVFSGISKKLGMDYTAIVGRKGGSCVDVISDAQENTHYLHVRNASPPILSVSDFVDNYKTRIISPKDKLDVIL